MPNNRLISMLMALGMLGACSEGEQRDFDAQNDNGTDFSMRVDGGDEGGTVSIDVPGLSGNLRLPAIKLDNAKVDIDGVQLYPGAELTSVDVAGEGGISDAGVVVRFLAHATAAQVRDYYMDAFEEKGVKASASGNTITGVTDEGKPFSIALSDEGETVRGTMRLNRRD